jgi:hypothetical protein
MIKTSSSFEILKEMKENSKKNRKEKKRTEQHRTEQKQNRSVKRDP